MTHTPEHPSPSPEAITTSDEARSMYSIDRINEWRSDEWLRLDWWRIDSIASAPLDPSYVDAYKDTTEEKLDEFLASKGITSDDAEYAAIRQLYRDASPDRCNENEWGNSPASRGVDPSDTQSQSDKVREVVRQWHESHAEVEPDEEERSIETIETELGAARETWASMQAKRQGRLWDRRIKGYNAAKEKYETLQHELGSRMLADIVNDDSLSDADKNAAVLYYVFEEQNKLRQETKDRVKNTHIKRFVAKLGDWLNDGEKNRWWSKFGRGVLVGAGAGVVGAGVGLLFGAAGVGAAVVGAGVMVTKGAVSFTRSYAMSDAKNNRGMEALDNSVRDADWTGAMDGAEGDTVLDKGLRISRKAFEDDTKNEQSKRRKTTALAMGGAAVGTVLGVTGGWVLDHTGASGFVQDRVGGWFGSMPGQHATPVDNGSVGGATKAPLVIDPNRIDDLPTPGADVPGLPLAPEPELPGLPLAPEVDLPVFDFGYGTATEHLLQDVASEQLGVKLDGREAYLLINHLMEETGGKVFEGVDTVWHSPGNVWIMNPGGETSGLTADAVKVAQEWLNMGRPGLPKAGV